MNFDLWFGQYTQCPRCHTSDAVRMTASNAWYVQQGKIEDLEKEIEILRSAIRQVGDLAQLQSQIPVCGRIMATAIFALVNKNQLKAEMRVNSQILEGVKNE